MFIKEEKNDDLEFLGVKLIKVEDYFLLSNTKKLMRTVRKNWFKSLMDELREVIGNHYCEFQIYVTYVDLGKDSTIVGYVYVIEGTNKTEEESPDVTLNSAMLKICEKYEQMRLLFVTIERKREDFEKLKKGSAKEHFMQAIEKK